MEHVICSFVRSFAFLLCAASSFYLFFTWWSTCHCTVTLCIYFFPCLGSGIVLLFFFFFFFFRKDGWFLCKEGWDRGIFGCGWVLASFLVEEFLVFACGYELDWAYGIFGWVNHFDIFSLCFWWALFFFLVLGLGSRGWARVGLGLTSFFVFCLYAYRMKNRMPRRQRKISSVCLVI